MVEQRLYSVAAIAKILDVPESTLHYWKNRFDDVLPSVGRGRAKRFKAEAVDIFRTIHTMLGQGLSCADVRAELLRRPPVTLVTEPGEATPTPRQMPVEAPVLPENALVMVATRIGTEIAKSLLAQLRQSTAPPVAALPDATVETLQSELARVQSENAAMTEKMRLLEAELVRLRKDRRELEAYLVAKINALGRSDEERRGNKETGGKPF